MKISYNWLKELLPGLDRSPDDVSALLTMSGLEVESVEEVESIKGGLKGVVVGEVLTKAVHPNADRLSVTTVDVGEQVLPIVCGAANVAAGQKVLVATPGAVLHTFSGEKIEIKKSKIRGEVSEGMICAEDELGLGESHAGIMVLDPTVKKGTEAAALFNLSSDYVLEIGLTPNRADAVSHFGVARDLRAVLLAKGNKTPELNTPKISTLPGSKGELSEILDKDGCSRYSALKIHGITVTESPAWMKQRLNAIGLKPINNIVDVTNYVMFDIGQPLHAFDLSKIPGEKVKVQTVKDGSEFKTLDGTVRKLSSQDLMICDNHSEPLCIAGVYGGLNSGVSENTKSILLESACFNSVYVRKTSKRHGLKTDASFRFERGTDPEATVIALQRAVELLKETCPDLKVEEFSDNYPVKADPYQMEFELKNLAKIGGFEIPKDKVVSILESLGIRITSQSGDTMQLSVPRFKTDVTREADVIEEVLRIYGYDQIPVPTKLKASIQYSRKIEKEKVVNHLSEALVGAGFSEVLNNSLSSVAHEKYSETEQVKLLNPLSSELGVMRSSMLFSLLDNVRYNINRKAPDLKLFELGKVYAKAGEKYQEAEKLALLVTGNESHETWIRKQQPASFYTLKAVVKNLLEKCNAASIKEEVFSSPVSEEGLKLSVGKSLVATVQAVSSEVLQYADIDQPVYFAEIDTAALVRVLSDSKVEYKELPKFPAVRRDLALLIDEAVSYDQLRAAAFDSERKLLKEVNLFDVYRGKNLEPGKKSYALSFIMQDENATLNDKQIERVFQNLQKLYTEKFGATIR